MKYQTFKALSLNCILIFTSFVAYPMEMKKDRVVPPHCPEPLYTEDNPGACCLCGLIVCTCASGTVSFLALTEAFYTTAAVWGLCSVCSGYCLSEIYHGYRDEQKRLETLRKNH